MKNKTHADHHSHRIADGDARHSHHSRYPPQFAPWLMHLAQRNAMKEVVSDAAAFAPCYHVNVIPAYSSHLLVENI